MSEKLGSGYEKTGEIDQLVAEQLKNASEVFLKNCETVAEAVERMACVIGVKIGVKPAGLIGVNYSLDDQDVPEKLEENLHELGIDFVSREMGGYQQYYIGKDVDTAQELQETFARYYQGSDDRKVLDAKLGQLLGYPETATQYVVNGGTKYNRVNKRKDVLIIHDPKHFQEEYDAYEKPIYEIMDECCPELSRLRKQQVKQNFGRKVLGLFKKD